jgi:hypothetical protein
VGQSGQLTALINGHLIYETPDEEAVANVEDCLRLVLAQPGLKAEIVVSAPTRPNWVPPLTNSPPPTNLARPGDPAI